MPKTKVGVLSSQDVNGLNAVAKNALILSKEQRIWLFKAEMGAGKTTFIQFLGKHLGVKDRISSPTFSIVNEYSDGICPVYHFDFYRIKNEKEVLDIGMEEYFDSGYYCLVEWPKMLGSLVPNSYFLIEINLEGESLRKYTFSHIKDD